MTRVLTAMTVATIALGLCSIASADIVILGSSDRSARAGDRVHVRLSCGGCPHRGLDLPVLLLPIGKIDREHPCRGSSCAPSSVGPPTDDPYLPIGVSHTRPNTTLNRLSFLVPDAPPGPYAYVVYCSLCIDGPRGSMIGHPTRHTHYAPTPAGVLTIR